MMPADGLVCVHGIATPRYRVTPYKAHASCKFRLAGACVDLTLSIEIHKIEYSEKISIQ